MENQTFNKAIGSVLKDAVDWDGNPADFSKKVVSGIGRYFRSKEDEDYPVMFDLDLGVDLSVLGDPRSFSGLQYVVAEAVYNSVKAYREGKSAGLRDGGIRVLAYEKGTEYRIEILDLAGGVPESVLKTGVPGEQTVRRTREKKTGGGLGFETMNLVLSRFGGGYKASHIKNSGEVVGTRLVFSIPKKV